MLIKSVTTPLKASADHLVAFILTSGNLLEAEKLARKFFDRNIHLNKNAGLSGAKYWVASENKKLIFLGAGKAGSLSLEEVRKTVYTAVAAGSDHKVKRLTLCFPGATGAQITAVTEAAMLSNYKFTVYKKESKDNSTLNLNIWAPADQNADFVKGRTIAEATMIARDLVNEPVNTLNATELASRTELLGKKFGFKTEILNKAKIQALKMGGLLAVNAGSIDPPAFIIMEWKPKNPTNKKPVVLLGKGVTYDTGGLSLKETAGSMDSMKCDMAGAAAVIGTFCGLAAMNSNLHVIGLAPATDNRPGENAMAPGDILTMMDGTTVEMLNSDAEGRLILADGLTYAKKFNPGLVIDLATLTGAAIVVIGNSGTVMTSTASDAVTHALIASGERTYERMVRLPLWDEFKELLRSDIADIKNIAGRPAGSITPAKFLEHFTNYPWIHLDIAGPAFITSQDSYHGKWATGVGVRLLLDFLENYQEG